MDKDKQKEKEIILRAFVTDAARNKNGAEVIALLEAMHMKDVELRRNADALKPAQQKSINARLAQRIKKQNRDLLKEKSPELQAHQPIASSVTYYEYVGTGLAEKIQKANNSNDKKASELEKRYQEAMEELDISS